jgi:hypothetical protein
MVPACVKFRIDYSSTRFESCAPCAWEWATHDSQRGHSDGYILHTTTRPRSSMGQLPGKHYRGDGGSDRAIGIRGLQIRGTIGIENVGISGYI